MSTPEPQTWKRNVFVLCFDGTGNKFSGTEADSNILKLFRMLDRSDATMYTFYQPGIGTYITSNSMQTTTAVGRVLSWYKKAKDSAVGSSFADHVMGAYTYLMKYYSCEDDLYFFGFSRGAYTARFLAEMLDHVGLLSAGNEELVRFAWKTYAKWAARKNDGTGEAQEKENEHYKFMSGFRETFCRPVRRIRFLGLFDTVNSVPRFEGAWMQRSKFPYTARPSAKVIRHAVSIDERRAKFRQDLLSGSKTKKEDNGKGNLGEKVNGSGGHPQFIEPEAMNSSFSGDPKHLRPMPDKVILQSPAPARRRRRRYSDMDRPQDVSEVWFAGGHADIGGGWKRCQGETWPLSHTPLVWMIHEAERAGLRFDPIKLAAFLCIPDEVDDYGQRIAKEQTRLSFLNALQQSYTAGVIHDCLKKGAEIPSRTALFWKMMEYLPFRRMDLQPDGSWKAIRWPLPMGETRDIPQNARIHYSAIERMRNVPDYRPGNLIIGGGGRGVCTAPPEYGIGDWEVKESRGDPIKETFVRRVAAAANGNGA